MATRSARAKRTSVRETVRSESRAAYREAILVAAERVFGRLGFHDAKMADIAAEAGVAAGTLYNYFKNKDQVFESILKRGQSRLKEELAPALELAEPLARLRAITETSLRFLEENGALFMIHIRRGGLEARSLRHIGEGNDDLHEFHEQLVREAFVQAIESKQLRQDIPADELAGLFSGLTEAMIFAWIRRGCPKNLAAKTDLIFDMFLQGAHPK